MNKVKRTDIENWQFDYTTEHDLNTYSWDITGNKSCEYFWKSIVRK